MLQKQKILGVGITTHNLKDILEYVYSSIAKQHEKVMIVTPNPEMLVYAKKHPAFKRLLNEATISLPDGVGVVLAAKIVGVSLKERITGVDFIEEVCRSAQSVKSKGVKKVVSIGFFGGGRGVAEDAAKCLQEKYPWVDIVFASDTWQESSMQPQKHIDILFVALGVPKQEKWIYNHLPHIPVTVAVGVGGAFDYYSKRIPRAPYWMRKIGFEWLFRLMVQPWRIKRQLSLITFISLVLKEKFALT